MRKGINQFEFGDLKCIPEDAQLVVSSHSLDGMNFLMRTSAGIINKSDLETKN